ncbi:MAG: hypothetical protein M1829_000709 [Trizodia sp. TS-e1964]|nr:MAG: hypothetical protein M1829_000709 [Trizodia sp. TS-e1964]
MADGESQEIDNYINSHPLANLLRSDPNMTESRPHLKIPDVYRDQSLTAGALAGPRKIVVPPLTWSEKTGKSLVAITYLGDDICGFPGIVHGGLLATLLDEGMARCCFPALPDKVGFTANLNINFRKPLRAGSFIVIKATTIKVDGRKALVEARIESLPKGDAEPVVFAEASGLFIQPKNGYQDMAKMLLAK